MNLKEKWQQFAKWLSNEPSEEFKANTTSVETRPFRMTKEFGNVTRTLEALPYATGENEWRHKVFMTDVYDMAGRLFRPSTDYTHVELALTKQEIEDFFDVVDHKVRKTQGGDFATQIVTGKEITDVIYGGDEAVKKYTAENKGPQSPQANPAP